jgi:GH24 family phage-related lysozyme (muramidase)
MTKVKIPASAGKRAAAIAAIAAAMAVPFEGLRQYAYYDPPGILTVCYGHTGDVIKGRKYTINECNALLSSDMLDAVFTVERCAPGLPYDTAAALSDAVFNIGPKIVCDTKASTLARKLRAGDIRGACEQLPRWSYAKVSGVSVKLPGLVKRRNAEMQLCLAGLNNAF